LPNLCSQLYMMFMAAVTINRLRSANRLSSTELKSEFRLKLILCDTLARFLWYYGGVWYINILC
jgi:hypothetical protein